VIRLRTTSRQPIAPPRQFRPRQANPTLPIWIQRSDPLKCHLQAGDRIRTGDVQLERLGGLDERDQLLFKDIVRSNVLTASSGLLPGTPAGDELTLSDAWLEVFQEVLPRAKYRSAGMLVAAAYRTDFGQELPLRQQFVDGAPRQVKSYRRSWLIDTLKRFRAQMAGG